MTNDSDLVQFGGVYRTFVQATHANRTGGTVTLEVFCPYRYHGKCVLVVNSESWDQEKVIQCLFITGEVGEEGRRNMREGKEP